MKTINSILAFTAATIVTAQTGFAQTAAAPAPTPAPAPISLDFLGSLFSGSQTPDEAAIRSAFSTAGLTVERYRTGWDGEVRVRATTADGQEVRVRVDDGEIRYSLRSNGGSTDDNGPTSDANGADTRDDTRDGNGADTRDNTRDSNGGDTRGGNGGGSGGGNGGNS